jgi:branched-chain amino acid transport system permease protein
VLIWDIIASGLTLAALYACGTLALSLVWGSIGMLNMAHGAVLVVGGYASYYAVTMLAIPWWLGLPVGILAGLLAGLLLYATTVRWMFSDIDFGVNMLIATVAAATIIQDLITNLLGPVTRRQPFNLEGSFHVTDRFQLQKETILIIALSGLLFVSTHLLLNHTKLGRAIRAVAQEPAGALLVGVPLQRTLTSVMAIAGALGGGTGVLLTSLTTVYPNAGFDPLLKSLIICVVGGLGSLRGAFIAAIALGLFESAVDYLVGLRFGFSAMLVLVIFVLIVRPRGLAAQEEGVRV